MTKTGIEYLDFTVNPIVGCDMSLGCAPRCWARRMALRLRNAGVQQYAGVVDDQGDWTGKTVFSEAALQSLLRRRKPATVGLCFMADAFHESVPDEWLDRMLAVVALTPHLRYVLLTKRAKRMREQIVRLSRGIFPLEKSARDMGYTFDYDGIGLLPWPIPNLALGISASNQAELDARAPDLLATPAACRLLSLEPLVGEVHAERYLDGHEEHGIDLSRPVGAKVGCCVGWTPPVDGVLVGGESGPGARPMNVQWIRYISGQCKMAGVPLYVKQLGSFWARKENADPECWEQVDGKGSNPAEWPADLWMRDLPEMLRGKL